MNLPFEIEMQGPVVVNDATICNGSVETGIIAVNIDMKSKYIEVMQGSSSTGGEPSTPEILLLAGDDSLHLDGTKDKETYTILKFSTLQGWHVWCCSTGRYSVYVCFVKD